METGSSRSLPSPSGFKRNFTVHKSLLVFGTSTDQTQNKEEPKKSRGKDQYCSWSEKFNVNQQYCFSLLRFCKKQNSLWMPCFFRPLALEQTEFLIKSLPLFSDSNEENKFGPFSQASRLQELLEGKLSAKSNVQHPSDFSSQTNAFSNPAI